MISSVPIPRMATFWRIDDCPIVVPGQTELTRHPKATALDGQRLGQSDDPDLRRRVVRDKIVPRIPELDEIVTTRPRPLSLKSESAAWHTRKVPLSRL